jgi:hypothetical protein
LPVYDERKTCKNKWGFIVSPKKCQVVIISEEGCVNPKNKISANEIGKRMD